jgi:Ca2+-binding RTX toxin-like protein
MAIVKFVSNGGFSDFAGGTVVTSLETKYVYTSTSGKTITLFGTDFSYDPNGVLFSGTVTSVRMTTGSTVNLTVSGLSFSALEFSELALGLVSGLPTIAPDTHALEISMLSGIDTLYDGAGNADMYGREGNDVLRAGDGQDWLYGGQGVDRYFGDAGYDFVSFWDGAHGVKIDLTRISGQVRDDGFGNIETAAGVEGWDGSDFGDIMLGGETAVTFYGQNGNDSLTGGAGDDSIWGGDGLDTLQGGAGSNTLDLWVNDSGHAVSVDLRKVTGQILDDGYGNTETATGFQAIWGSKYNDRMIGNSGGNLFMSGDGADNLSGLGGNDTLYGGAGIDTIYGGTGSDHLHGKEGSNILVGGADADYFYFADHISDIGGLRQTVTDFVHGVDHIVLDSDMGGFNALGAVAASQFRAGAGFTTAITADQRLIYNTTNGLLYLDVDGLGGTAAVQIGHFKNLPTLTAADFQIEYQP